MRAGPSFTSDEVHQPATAPFMQVLGTVRASNSLECLPMYRAGRRRDSKRRPIRLFASWHRQAAPVVACDGISMCPRIAQGKRGQLCGRECLRHTPLCTELAL